MMLTPTADPVATGKKKPQLPGITPMTAQPMSQPLGASVPGGVAPVAPAPAPLGGVAPVLQPLPMNPLGGEQPVLKSDTPAPVPVDRELDAVRPPTTTPTGPAYGGATPDYLNRQIAPPTGITPVAKPTPAVPSITPPVTSSPQPLTGSTVTTSVPAGGVSPWTGEASPAPLTGGIQPLTPGEAGLPSPAAPSAPTAPFTPDNNLIGSSITPVDSAATTRARDLTSQGLESLYSAPDRTQLAQDALKRFVADQDIDYARRQQDVGRTAATFGRLGSGMTADDVVRLGRSREAELLAKQSDLANQTSQQILADRLDRLNASRGVAGDFGATDASNRGELRGERDYQYGLSRDAQTDRVNQRMLEDQLLNSSENRSLNRARFGADVGYSNDPYSLGVGAARDTYNAGMDQQEAAAASAGARARQGSTVPASQPYDGYSSLPTWSPAPGGPPLPTAGAQPNTGGSTIYIPGVGIVPIPQLPQDYARQGAGIVPVGSGVM